MLYCTVTGVGSKQAVPSCFFGFFFGLGVCVGVGVRGSVCGGAFVSFLSKVCSFTQKGGKLPVDVFVPMSDSPPMI